MLREGPRRPAVACETGDWSHVDVYLTRRHRLPDAAAGRVPVGGRAPALDRASAAPLSSRSAPTCPERRPRCAIRGDEDDDVRLLAEVTVPELVAAQLWRASGSA